MKILSIDKSSGLAIIDQAIEVIDSTININLIALIEASRGKDNLKKVLINNEKYKDDSDVFNKILTIVSNFRKSLPEFRKTIVEELPDVLMSDDTDINVRLGLGYISQAIRYSVELIPMLNFIIEKYYTQDVVANNAVNDKADRLLTLMLNLEDDSNVEFDNITDAIGNIPVLKSFRKQNSNFLPDTLFLNYLAKEFKIKGKATIRYIEELFNSTPKHTKSFSGNPFMLIRMFMVDYEVLKLEKLNNDKRLLEVRILDLKTNDDSLSKSLQKQINYYTYKIEKLDLKIKNIIGK